MNGWSAMREQVSRGTRSAALFAVLVTSVSLVLGACTVTPGGPPAPGSERSVWMAGDSNGGAIASTMRPGPFHISVGASGFTTRTRTRILDNTQAQIDLHGAPETMLATGGVLDAMVGATTEEIINEMETFESSMTTQGMRVIFVVEPAFTLKDVYEPIADWIRAHPDHVDCSAYNGYTLDGIHPIDFKPIAACVNNQLSALGVVFYDRPI